MLSVDLQSLDFTFNRLFVKKMSSSGSVNVVEDCRTYCGIEMSSCLIKK